jgi:hypothetical protein
MFNFDTWWGEISVSYPNYREYGYYEAANSYNSYNKVGSLWDGAQYLYTCYPSQGASKFVGLAKYEPGTNAMISDFVV